MSNTLPPDPEVISESEPAEPLPPAKPRRLRSYAARYANRALLTVAALVVSVAGAVFAYESARDPAAYVFSHGFTPTESEYHAPARIAFYVFDELREAEHAQIINTLRCDFGYGFEYVSSKTHEDPDFMPYMNLAPNADEIAAELATMTRGLPRVHLDAGVRRLAAGIKAPSWVYSGDHPREDAACIGVHQMIARTDWFDLRKIVVRYSGPFHYYAAKGTHPAEDDGGGQARDATQGGSMIGSNGRAAHDPAYPDAATISRSYGTERAGVDVGSVEPGGAGSALEQRTIPSEADVRVIEHGPPAPVVKFDEMRGATTE